MDDSRCRFFSRRATRTNRLRYDHYDDDDGQTPCKVSFAVIPFAHHVLYSYSECKKKSKSFEKTFESYENMKFVHLSRGSKTR